MPNYCRTCGHTLAQHSSGECDLKGCACEGWSSWSTPVEFYPTDGVDTVVGMTLLGVAFVAGLGLGFWLWS